MKLKLRFTKCGEDYFIDQKKWWGWKQLGIRQNHYGNTVFISYRMSDKQKLLDYVLTNYFKRPKSAFTIYLYPQLEIL